MKKQDSRKKKKRKPVKIIKNNEMEKEGLYTGPTEDSFKSAKDVKLDAIKSGDFMWLDKEELEEVRDRSFEEWQALVSQRQEARQEMLSIPSIQSIDINSEVPVTLALIGDVHAGADNTDYELFGYTLEIVKEVPSVKAVLLGDLVDAFFWNQAAQGDMMNHVEQVRYMQAALDTIKDEVLCAYKGNHERWSERTTVSPLYYKWVEEFGTPYFEGKGTLELNYPKQTYSILGAHRLPGHSMYNDNHPQMREARFGEQGRDVYVSGHTHHKSYHSQFVNVGGDRIQQHYINVGTFKEHDNYGADKGYDPFTDDQLGAVFVTLYPDKRDVEVDMTLEQVYRRFE